MTKQIKKSTLGIPLGVLAAIMYIACAYSGLTATLLIAGYVLLKEKDEWLKTQAVKVVLLVLVFAAIDMVIDIVPDTINLISNFFGLFGGSFSIPFIPSVINFIGYVLNYIKPLVFLALAYKSLSMKTVKLPFIDSVIEKVASGEATEFSDLSEEMKEDLDIVKEGLGKAKDNVVKAAEEAKDKIQEAADKVAENKKEAVETPTADTKSEPMNPQL